MLLAKRLDSTTAAISTYGQRRRTVMGGRHDDSQLADDATTPGTTSPVRHNDDPWSVAWALMMLQTSASETPRTEMPGRSDGNPWRPATDAAKTTMPRYVDNRHTHNDTAATARPEATLATNAMMPAVAATTATPGPKTLGIAAGDGNIMPPRFDGSRGMDAPDWA